MTMHFEGRLLSFVGKLGLMLGETSRLQRRRGEGLSRISRCLTVTTPAVASQPKGKELKDRADIMGDSGGGFRREGAAEAVPPTKVGGRIRWVKNKARKV
ncbi:hypothetical protein F2Q69_00052079 [Brassica cretica]|uniref:Uncharacterized protein n=1 Tax=Brassica cretica TaxID=69181 RepID=A0A8S9MSU4_BRACR|nr:hypothetical protein F2Q69_00052079 [Brassica cretica]